MVCSVESGRYRGPWLQLDGIGARAKKCMGGTLLVLMFAGMKQYHQNSIPGFGPQNRSIGKCYRVAVCTGICENRFVRGRLLFVYRRHRNHRNCTGGAANAKRRSRGQTRQVWHCMLCIHHLPLPPVPTAASRRWVGSFPLVRTVVRELRVPLSGKKLNQLPLRQWPGRSGSRNICPGSAKVGEVLKCRPSN